MKRFLAFLWIISLASSCVEKVIEKPKDLISKERMTNILFDIAILQGAKSTNSIVLENNGIEIMPLIYEKYQIDSVQFVQSDLYYASVPLTYQSIYETIEARLEQQRVSIEEERKQKNDSLRSRTKKITDSVRQANEIKKTSDTLF